VTCASVRTKRSVRAASSSALPRPSSTVAPLSSSSAPGAAARQRKAPHLELHAREQRLQAAVQRQHLRRAALGAAEHRQGLVLDIADVGLEDLAEAVDQALVAVVALPQRHRHGVLPGAPPAGRARRGAPRPGAPRARPRRPRAPARSMLKKLPARRGVALARMVARCCAAGRLRAGCADGEPRRTRQPQHAGSRSASARRSRNTAGDTPFIRRTSRQARACCMINQQAAWRPRASLPVAFARRRARRRPAAAGTAARS
jgi:hypothetical protein